MGFFGRIRNLWRLSTAVEVKKHTDRPIVTITPNDYNAADPTDRQQTTVEEIAGVVLNKPKRPATIVSMEEPINQFPEEEVTEETNAETDK